MPSEPVTLINCIKSLGVRVERIGLEAGPCRATCKFLQINRRPPLASRGTASRRSTIPMDVDLGWRTVRHYSRTNRMGCRRLELSSRELALHPVEANRAACTDHLDELPLWWSPSLVCLLGPGQRQILWTPRRRAVSRRRSVRVPTLFWVSLPSQQGGLQFRNLRQSQKIRTRLGASPGEACEPFPDKPRRMHQRTYERLRAQAEEAEAILLWDAARICQPCDWVPPNEKQKHRHRGIGLITSPTPS